MPTASALQRILDPIDVAEFIEDYFQRRPLRLRGSAHKFDFLFRKSEFWTNLDRVRRIRAVFPKSNRQARIEPADIADMLRMGATICVTGMESAHPRLSHAARVIRSELNYAGDVSFRAYLSPPGSGFDLHFDARVTTTLQIAGTKRWWFSKAPAVPFPRHNSGREPAGSVAYSVPKLSGLRSVTLRPGDVLCLPAGVWHRAKGSTMSLALNMAFDHNGGTVVDAVMNTLHERLMHDSRWREPLPVVPRRNGRGIPQSVVAVFRDRIDELQSELSAMRNDKSQLERAWQMAVRPRRT